MIGRVWCGVVCGGVWCVVCGGGGVVCEYKFIQKPFQIFHLSKIFPVCILFVFTNTYSQPMVLLKGVDQLSNRSVYKI